MNEISKLTCQESILTEILNRPLEASIISAVSGSGKSYLCSEISKQWIKSDLYACITLNNNEDRVNGNLSPFIYGIKNSTSNSIKQATKNVIESSCKDVPLIGNTLSAIVNNLFVKDNKQKQLLSDNAFSILKIYDYLFKNKNLMFICENIDTWDDESLYLLILIINGTADFSFLRNCTFVLTTSSDIIKFKSQISIPCIEYFLKPVRKESVNQVLKLFGNPITLNKKQIDTIFGITGGNLELLNQISKLLSSEKCDETLFTSVHDVFDLIDQRISNTSSNPNELLILLKKASVIGESFKRFLLQYFYSDSNIFLNDLIDESCQMEFTKCYLDNIQFNNKAIYKIFLDNVSTKERKLHTDFEKCLAVLQPTNYKARSEHLLKGGDEKVATIFHIIFSFKYFRENGKEYNILDDLFTDLVEKYGFRSYYETIINCYQLFFRSTYNDALSLIQTLQYYGEPSLKFEIDYLTGLLHINFSEDLDILQEQQIILESWVENMSFRENSFEMWLRCSLCLLDYYLYTESVEPLKRLRKNIVQSSVERMNTDEGIEEKFYMFSNKANVYCQIESAFNETSRALNYFSLDNENKSLNLVKFYVSLVNHSANAIVLSKFDIASNCSNQALNLTRSFQNISFPRPEIMINNFILSSYFNNTFSAEEAKDNFESLISSCDVFADLLLIKSNLAVFYCLTNNFKSAQKILTVLETEISQISNNDNYYQYYIINNCAIFNYLYGNYEKAIELWNMISSKSPLMHEKTYFNKRNSLISAMINKKELLNFQTSDWNDYLIKNFPEQVGNAWNFWGKIMLFSDLQTWSYC